MAIVWGSVDGNDKGKLGIEITTSESTTSLSVTANVYFWSKWSVSDSVNTFCFDWASSASTSKGAVNIKTTIDSGSWSDSNKIKIASYSTSYSKGSSAQIKYAAASLSTIEVLLGKISVSTSFTVPALPTYTITYNANGGANAPSKQTKTHGTNLTLSATKPTKTGYTFLGWSTSSSATVASYEAGGTYTSNSDTTLYAVWTSSTYNIKIYANGGIFSDGTEYFSGDITYGNTQWWVLNPYLPTRVGYTLKGFFTSTNGGTKVYDANGECIPNTSYWDINYCYCYAGNLAVYAQWEPNTYTLTLDTNNGTNIIDSLSLTYETNQNHDISQYTPTRKAYEFLGWYSSPTGGIQIYDCNGLCTNEGTYWENDLCVCTSNYTLYAQWKPLNIAYYKKDNKWNFCNFYVKTEATWKPAILYKKTDGNFIF